VATAAGPAPAPGGAALEENQQIETLIVGAEVFAKNGLSDRAIERLFSLVRRRPDLLKARERLVELLGESGNPALSREAESLAALYRESGREDDSRRVLARAGLPAPEPPPAAPAAPPAAHGAEVDFDEFEIGHPASPPAEMPAAAAPYEDSIDFAAGEPGPPP